MKNLHTTTTINSSSAVQLTFNFDCQSNKLTALPTMSCDDSRSLVDENGQMEFDF